MAKLTKAQKAEKISQAKSILINATKSLGFSMLPPNETFDVSIKDGVTLESIEESAITTESGVHKFVPVICVSSDNKEFESSLYCGHNDKTPADRIDWHVTLFEECSDIINELSFIGKTSDVKKNKNGYDVTYLSIEE